VEKCPLILSEDNCTGPINGYPESVRGFSQYLQRMNK